MIRIVFFSLETVGLGMISFATIVKGERHLDSCKKTGYSICL